MKFLTKRTWIIGGLTLGIIGGGFLFESTDVIENTFASSKDEAQLIKEAEIKKEEAKTLALEEVDGEIVEQEVEDEDQTIVYEFNIKTDSGIQEVEVDGMSGDIIEVEREDEDQKENNDSKQEEQKNNKTNQ